jgi:hypothetical protein
MLATTRQQLAHSPLLTALGNNASKFIGNIYAANNVS